MERKDGIIVKGTDFRDNDRIIYLITPEGKVSLILKSAKKASMKTFAYSQELSKISYDSSKNYLTSGNVLSSYSNIKVDIKKLRSALLISEISYDLIEHINDYHTFYTFLDKVLELMNTTENYEILEVIFRIKTLYLLGVAPTLNKCVDCGTKSNLVGFSFYDGGMKCSLHNKIFEQLYLNDLISQIRDLYNEKLETIDLTQNIDYMGINLFLNHYYDNYLGFKSKVLGVFNKL